MEHVPRYSYRTRSGKEFEAGAGAVIGLGADGTIYIGYDSTLKEEISLGPEEEEDLCVWMALQWTKAAERARRKVVSAKEQV